MIKRNLEKINLLKKQPVCHTCKKQFETTRPNKIYCSKKCRDKRIRELKCKVCGSSMQDAYGKIFCSEKCKKKFYLIKYPPRTSKVCNYWQ